MIYLYLLVLITKTISNFKTIELNPKIQQQRNIVSLVDDNYVTKTCITYGLWSKFNPLSTVDQIGLVGMFDSNCFHLHNAMDLEQKNINIIYFDCLNLKTREITKTVQFINYKNQQLQFEIVIDELDYENIWYCFEIMIWPLQNKIKLLITRQQEIKFQTTKQMNKLLKDFNLLLTFGGNLQVQNNEIQIFSYFPGPIWLQEISIQQLNLNFNFFEQIMQTYETNFESCVCEQNDKFTIDDKDITNKQQEQFISKNTNCDSFVLNGWIKIKEIINSSDNLNYQLIKISANLKNPRLEDQNLSPFQLFYHITPQISEILITTYSYTFPDVTIDFSDNPFLQSKVFEIQNKITLWHYLKVALLKNQLKVEINFYEFNQIHQFDTEFNVNQFHQCQFKIQYGNLQKISPNHLSLSLRNFEFFNCYQESVEISCHFSCLECDGPTDQDCLSCSFESQRIYIPEYKVCVCPINTIDNQNQCQDYKQSKLQLIKDENPILNNNCEYGYFEFENDCLKCPSIIQDNMITCFECINNPKNWFKDPTCSNTLVIQPNTNLQEAFQTVMDGQFYFDGMQLNPIHYTNSQPYDYNLINIKGIYKEFQLAQTHFRNFCQQLDYQESDQFLCYECFIEDCQICQINIVMIQCLQCLENYKLIDGNCISEYLLQLEFQSNQQLICLSPFYQSFENQCKLCKIKNCIYCFEYSEKDLDLCSFLKLSEYALSQVSNVQIGCALCEQDYTYDFTLRLCLLQKPQLENCSRSYINLKSKELCIQSINSNFSIAPEISNCNNIIQNCQYCTIDNDVQFKCVTCESNYIVENNKCYENDEYNINNNLIERQAIQIQSFALQFVPQLNFNVYKQFLQDQPLLDELCAPECLLCVHGGQTYCKECPLNYYKKSIIAELSSQCEYCPPLCQVCENRQIQDISPNFIINNDTYIYTKQCLKPHKDPQISFDPYSKFVKYCFNSNCQHKFVFEMSHYSCDFSKFNRFQETIINIDYCNQIGLDNLTVNFIFKISRQFCFLILPLNLKTELKQKIFTLQNVILNISTLEYIEMQKAFTSQFSNFDQVEINNIGFTIYKDQYFLFNNSKNKINIIITNFTIINSLLYNIESLFATEVFGNIILNNFTLYNTTFINSTMFNFEQYLLLGSIQITQLFIYNCTFIQSTIFTFSKQEHSISVSQFNLNQSTLNQSSIFSFINSYPKQGYLNGDYILFRNCNLIDSYFLNSTTQIEVNFNNFDLELNKLENSKIITVNYKIQLKSINIKQNLFIYSQLLSITQILFMDQIICNIIQMNAQSNRFQTSNIILIFSTYQTNNLVIYLNNFLIQNNTKYSKYDEIIQLFQMNSQKIRIIDFVIIENTEIVVFYISENNNITIQNILFNNLPQSHKIPQSQFCLKFNMKVKLIHILGFTKILIRNIRISNIFNIDGSIIEINPSQQNLSQDYSQIEIMNLSFVGNKLIQSNEVDLISFLIIESERKANVTLQNISFIQNFLHSYSSDAVSAATSLLYIILPSSYIEIQNLFYQDNALTNSTYSLNILRSDILRIINFTINNLNVLSQQQWINNYDIQFIEQINQENLNEIVFQILQIKNIGGAGQLSASNITCLNCSFSHILSMESFIFHITTKGTDGIINLINLKVNHANNNLKSIEKNPGCFNIQSQSSKLSLLIINSQFSNVFNRLGPSIFTIYPSKLSNSILIKNFILLNCISLLNQILDVQFSPSIADNNRVTIQNIRIIQKYNAWLDYFSKIGDFILQDLTDITNNKNSLILIQSSIVSIDGFVMEGILINQVFQFTNLPKLQIQNVYLQNIQLFYPFNLIQVSVQLQIKSQISIEQLSIKNTSLFNNNLISLQSIFINRENLRECTSQIQSIETKQKDYLYLGVNLLQSNNNEGNCLVSFQILSNQIVTYFKNIELNHNTCNQCDNGIIFFDLNSFKQIKIQNLNCNYNSIKKYGCLYFLLQTEIQSKIAIENSNFLFNNASQGSSISCSKARIQILNCFILQNYADDIGGGLYIQANTFGFIINNTIIIGNRARIGGGIYLDGQSNLKSDNFIQSILLFNQAQEYGDNVVEIPTHLAVFINQIENPSKIYMKDNKKINILNLKTYRMIEQGRQLYTNDLFISSNQIIKSLQIFDIHHSDYRSYIKEFRLFYKNSRNEILFNLLNSICLINSKIITRDLQEQDQKTNTQVLYFDNEQNSFDLGSLQFMLDPFEQNYDHLQIEIDCQLNDTRNNLIYLIKAKSLKCQLGEFYVDNGCQTCQQNQGFYSVTYNSTKCSIFDKSKYAQITSNMIKLLQGFWRPYNESDYIEYCFKNPLFCVGGWQVGDQICSYGHLGALCEECDIYDFRGFGNYFKNQWDQWCLKCEFELNSILTYLIVCIWSFISITMTLKSINSSNLLYAQLTIAQRFNKILFKLNQNLESIQMKMLINYLWIFSVIFTFNIKFSFSFLFIEQTTNSSYFMANDLDCYLSSIQQIPNVYLKIMSMLIFMMMQFNITFAGTYLYKFIRQQKYDLSILSNTALYLYVYNFAGLIKMFSSLVSKRQISQIDYIQGDLSLIYGTRNHFLWMFYFILPGLIIVGVLIPIFIFILLLENKNRLDKIKLRKHICYLLNEYRQEKFYWELIKISKKAILIFILTYFETDIILKASLLGLCLLMYQILATFHQPFISLKFNSLDLQSSQICSISIFLATKKYICEQKSYFGPSLTIQILIIGCLVKLCQIFMFGIVNAYLKKYKFLSYTKLYLFLNSKVPNFIITQILRNILEKEKLKEERIKNRFNKLRNHLIQFSKIKLQSSKLFLCQSSRIQSPKQNSRRNDKKFFLQNIDVDEYYKQ